MENFEGNISRSKQISYKIIRNTLFNAIGRFWGILLVLIITPYIIHHIGKERYGIWAIAGVITGYFELFDFGIGTSFEKYISEYFIKKDYRSLNEVINTGLLFYFIFGVVVVILYFLSIKPLIGLFNIPNNLNTETYTVFNLTIIIFAVANPLRVFAAIQSGLQRMDISNKIAMAISVPNIAGTLYFLEFGYGLPGLMFNNLIMVLLAGLINILVAYKILPELKFSPLMFTRKMFKSLFSYGYKLQISRFANLVSFQTDRLLITHFLGLGLVVYYQLGSSILNRIRQILLLSISALVPTVSEINAKNEKEYLNALYLRGSKYLIFFSIPVMLFIITNASLILLAWMGAGYEKSALVIQVLAAGYFAATVTGVASSIAAGVARTDIDMKFGILLSSLNLSLSIILIIKIGFIGVVLGTSISLIFASFIFIRMFHNCFSTIPLKSFYRLFYKPSIACALPVLIILLINQSFQNTIVPYGRIIYLTILLINGIIFSTVYIGIIILTKYFDTNDIVIFKDKIPFLRKLLRSYAN